MSFRFKIGDLVQFRFPLERGQVANPCMVLERITIECHGGTQYFYKLRGAKTFPELTGVCDLELEPYVMSSHPVTELLRSARDEAVANQHWPVAARIKQLIDELSLSAEPGEKSE